MRASLLGYLSMGLVALAIGAMATAWGLAPAVDLGASVIALLSIATLGLLALLRPITPPTH